MNRHNKLSLKGFAVWMVCVIFFLYEFLLRTIMGTFQHPLISDLNLSTLQFSLLSSTVFMVIYSIMQIPAGIIVGNIGLKKSLLIGSIACTFASFGFAYTTCYTTTILYRIFMGFGASFGFICLLVAVADWMPLKVRGMYIGLSQLIGTIGPIIAGGPLAHITESAEIHWRIIFLCLACTGIFITLLILTIVENNHKDVKEYNSFASAYKIYQAILRILMRSQPWLLGLYSGFIYCMLEYLSENEGRAFLVLKGIGITKAAYIISYSWIGYAIGCPILGAISDYIKRRKFVMLLAALIGLLSIILLIYSNNHVIILASFIGIGLSASGQSVAFASVTEQCEKPFVAVGVGINNTILGIVAATNAPLIAILLDAKSTPLNVADYQSVFMILIFVAFIALLVASLFLKETYCKISNKFTRRAC